MGLVSAKLKFSKSTYGIVDFPGVSIVGAGLRSFEKAYNLWEEPNTGAIILKPNIEETKNIDMDRISLSLDPSNDWEYVDMGGVYSGMKKMLHHKRVDGMWSIQADGLLNENQGFMVWWTSWAIDKSIDEEQAGLEFFFGNLNSSSSYTLVLKGNGQSYMLDPIDVFGDYLWEGGIKESFSFSPLGDTVSLNLLLVFFVDKYIILGIGGTENVITIANPYVGTEYFPFETDADGNKYPILLPGGSSLFISGAGRILIGLNKIVYYSEGEGISKWYYVEKNPGLIECYYTKWIRKSGQYLSGSIKEQEELGDGRFRFKYRIALSSVNPQVVGSPVLYSWAVKSPMIRMTATGGGFTLETDIKGYRQTMSEGKNGQFQGGDVEFDITCYEYYYTNLVAARGHSVEIELSPGVDDEGNPLDYIKMGTFYVDVINVKRPEFGVFEMTIRARDVVKRCENSLILESVVYDSLPKIERRHGDVIKSLSAKAGVDISIPDDYSTDPVLPASEDSKHPNWQFQRGANIWECMELIRQFSGWILYPNRDGILVYRKRPETGEPKYVFTEEDYKELEGEVVDYVRTRFTVYGVAGTDGDSYKKGDIITAAIRDKDLEEELGETRPGVYINPFLGSIEQVKSACLGLYNWYKRPHKRVRFVIPDMRKYMDLWLYDIIEIKDNKMTDFNGLYIITGLSIEASPYIVWGTIEGLKL